MAYRRQFQSSVSISQESSFSEHCSICLTFRKGFTLWIRQHHYARQSSYTGKSLKTINSIVKKNSDQYSINFKDAIIMANDQQLYQLEYKNINKIFQQVKKTVFDNLHGQQHYNKMYFGEQNFNTMLNYQAKKKAILQFQIHSDSRSKTKFKVNNSAFLNNLENRILQDSTLKRNYDFYPVQMFPKQQKSKVQISLCQIQKLKKNLSIMIHDINTSDQSYPNIKNLKKPYIDFIKSKDQLKFRKILENNVSEIHQDNHKKMRKSQNFRLYTGPDIQDDLETRNNYAEAYGFLMQQNPQVKKRKKKSLLRKEISREKSSSNLSRTRPNNCTKNSIQNQTKNSLQNITKNSIQNYTKRSRQATQQASQLMISQTGSCATFISRKSKSKSKLKVNSKNKIMMATSTSGNKLRITSPNAVREKSLNRSKKLLMQYKL